MDASAAEIAIAARTLGEVFSQAETAHDVAPAMTCTEVDAIADLLSVLGYRFAALDWIRGHAESSSEEEEDSHYRVNPTAYLNQL